MRSTVKIGVLLFLVGVFYILVNFFTANSYSKVVISGTFTEDVELKLFYAKRTHDFSKTLFISADVEGSSKEQKVEFQLNNRIAHQFKLIASSGTEVLSKSFLLNTMTLHSFFHTEPARINLERVNLSSPSNIDLKVEKQKLKLNSFIHYVLPFFLACVFHILIFSFDWKSFPAISDLFNNHGIRGKDNILALDGLRGIAALTVLLDHTMWQFNGLGRAGVWLFFVLSGFLLIRPFVLFPEKMFTYEGLKNYLIKRIKRVIPMFYFMVTIIFLLEGRVASAARHYLLIQGDGHFWTILHEFYFYILLPFVAYFLYFLFKQKHVYILLSLVLLSIAWYSSASASFISIYSLGVKQVPFFYIFFIGMAGGYFYYGLVQSSEKFKNLLLGYSTVLSVSAICILLLFFLFSSNIDQVPLTHMALKYPLISTFFAMSLVLLSVISDRESLYNRVLSLNLFRLIGVVGYSFYLIHPYMIAVFKTSFIFVFAVSPVDVLPSIIIFVCSFVLTLPVAMFTYSYIERPFLKKA